MRQFMKMQGMLLLALLLSCTAAVAIGSVQDVSAKTVKAKSIKIKKKKVSVTVGQKVKLGVTVKPKKATIKWSSSNKKVATVTKKGVVKGIRKGTAKITARSGKKKAVCTVKVKAAKAGIKSVTVLTTKSIRVTLTKAASLKASNFSIKKKSSGRGAYNTTLKVASITKQSSKVYDVILSTDPKVGETYAIDDTNMIFSGDYVQVTVKKLGGVKTKEALYYASRYARNTYESLLVGEKYERGFGFSQDYVGYVSGIKVSGVPSGLTAKAYGSTVYVEGTPKTAKASVMTFTGKDELGKKLTQKVYFYIGSPSVMLSYIETEGRTILANDNSSDYFTIHTVGGSGSYTYSLPANTNKLISVLDRQIEFDAYIYNAGSNTKTYLNPGNYNVSYTVKDSKGHVNNGKLAVSAVKGVMVSGKVTAADNSGIADAYVRASMKDEKHIYSRNYCSAYTYEAGETDNYGTAKKNAGDYNMIVYPSQTYNFYAHNGDVYAYNNAVSIAKSNVVKNFKLPIYKVTISSGSDSMSGISWRDVYEDTVGYGSTLYLKKGTYKLTGTSSGGLYKYTANFTVNGNCKVNATRTTNFTLSGTLTAGTPQTVSLDGWYKKYYAFTPAASGTYTVSTSSVSRELSVQVLDGATGSSVVYADNVSYVWDGDGDYYYEEYGELSTNVALTAGKTYYLCLNSDYTIDNFTVTVSQTPSQQN